jgi:hypothetical protein
MYSIEEIERSVHKVLAKEKLNEDQTRFFFKMLIAISEEVLNPEQEITTKTEPTMDIDELIKKRMKEDKVQDSKQLSISWFLKQGFSDVLDSSSDYYKLRDELLKHSKILKVHPNSLDYLIIEKEEANV